MIIDLTKAFNTIHHLWDALGVLLGVGFAIFIPLAVVVASVIKISESKNQNLKKDNK